MRRLIAGGFLVVSAGFLGCSSGGGSTGGSGATGGTHGGASGSAGVAHTTGGTAGADHASGGTGGVAHGGTTSAGAGTNGGAALGGAGSPQSETGGSSGSGGSLSGSGGSLSGSGGSSSGSGGSSSGGGGSSGSGAEAGATDIGGAAGEAGANAGGSVSLGGSLGLGGASGASGSGGTPGSGGVPGTGGASAGVGGGGTAGAPAACQDGAIQPCCEDGHQTCSGGVWGACEGAIVSPETCNGVDDDCNGQVDDLGTFSCGVGACATTVVACGAQGLSSCVPPSPATSLDGCDGVDNDCDGAVDEDCSACVRVAPNGDDAAANGDNNATPFATVQAAIDFAAAHPSGAARVCVAGGATCQNSATYNGPANAELTMRDGIDVFANYESTGWTRCSVANTTLAPQTPLGVSFPPAVTSPTTLDGFIIVRSTAGTSTAAITVDGATNVVLSNLVVPKNTSIANAYGIVLQNGAEALVYRSRIEVFNSYGTSETIGIKSVGSRLYLQNSSGASVSNYPSPPCSATGNGVVLSMGDRAGAVQYGVLLENSPGSVLEDSDVCTRPFSSDTSAPNARVAAVAIHGDATGTVLRGNRLITMPYGSTPRAALALSDCAGAAPWITGNSITLENTEGAGPVTLPEAIYAAGACHPRIDSNAHIAATTGSYGTAVHCGTQGGVDSRCIISHNADIGVNVSTSNTGGPSSYLSGTGVQCDGAACARIDRNQIRGVAQATYSASCPLNVSGTGLTLGQSAALVAGNVIVGNVCSTNNSDGIGMSSGGPARIENNFIYGSRTAAGHSQCLGTKTIIGLSVSGAADVNSNYIASGFTGCWAQTDVLGLSGRFAYAVDSGSGPSFRNNVMEGCASFLEYSANADPLLFQNNDLPNGYLNEGATYPNPDFSDPRLTAAQVNALTDMTASGNISASCSMTGNDVKHLAAGAACIDAGTSSGAPTRDYDGQARDAAPDIGADEYLP